MTPDRAFESHYSDLVSVINRIMAHMTDFYQVFSMVSLLRNILERLLIVKLCNL